MKIFHHNDLDGRCSAAIALRWAEANGEIKGDLKVVEVDYKDSVDLSEVKNEELIIIVDFSFKPEVIKKILEKTEDIFWIDHHKTAQHYPYQYLDGLRDFSDKGKSGCELTWEFFHGEEMIPEGVVLIGDYDKWALKFQPQCFEFYEGLKLNLTTPKSTIWDAILSHDSMLLRKIKDEGKIAICYRDNYCEKICNDFGYDIEWEGHKAFATNFYQFGSKGFGNRMEQYDFCAAYIHDGHRFTVSIYSIKDVDVSEICKKYGGGGHKGAAGFVCETLPWRKA